MEGSLEGPGEEGKRNHWSKGCEGQGGSEAGAAGSVRAQDGSERVAERELVAGGD